MSEIDNEKNRLRSEIKTMRRGMNKEDKKILDDGVFENLLKCSEFVNAETVLVYKSTEIEVSTEKIIANSDLSGATSDVNLQKVNDQKRDLVYGLDYEVNNVTDVVAQEQDQKEEAITYFSALSDTYIANNGGVSPIPKTDIKKDMTQVFHIDLSGTAGAYNVKVWVEFTCEGLRGTGSSDTYPITITDVTKTDLKNIYLIYDKISNTDRDGHIKPEDEVVITGAVAGSCEPNLILYCKNQYDGNTDITAPDYNYGVNITGLTSNQAIYTNIRSYSGTKNYGIVKGNGAILQQAENMSEADLASKHRNQYTQMIKMTGTEYTSDKPVKATYVQVDIYKKNHTSTDEPYVSMTTTKGE